MAINLPAQIRLQLANYYLNLGKILPKQNIKPVETDNFHITLYFLGDQSEERVKKISQAAERAVDGWRKFNLTLDGLNAFPCKKFPRILVLNVKGGDLQNLRHRLGRELKTAGIEIDERPWHAHITLARIASGEISFAELEKIKIPAIEWPVASAELMQSHLNEAGAKYKIIKTFAL